MKVKAVKPSIDSSKNAWISDLDQYKKLYDKSVNNPEQFWTEVAKRITWTKKWDKFRSFDFVDVNIKFFEGGKLNVAYNCLDRHVENGHGDQTALIWEGNDPEEDKNYTYIELKNEVSKFANVLKSNGVEKGDRVCLYLQMIPELTIAMLACARIGAVHSIVFGAFSSDALRDRINDSACKVLITQDTGVRGKKLNIPMKTNADKSVNETPSIKHVFVVKRTGEEVPMESGRDLWWHEEMAKASKNCPPQEMDAE
ncbi:MAG: AMP-binding protein, partial [Candidatus Neomarinimicrobiota bacterium]